MVRVVILTLLYSSLVSPVSSMQRAFGVIDGTLIVGERDIVGRKHVIVFDSTTDSEVMTTSTVYSYNDETESVSVTGNVFPPDTFVRCNVGCHSDLINLTDFCYRVNPPSCIRMAAKNPIVYNVTSAKWYRDTFSYTSPDSLYTTYSIVY